jgi:DNA-binding NarL/FixJ family response regulator
VAAFGCDAAFLEFVRHAWVGLEAEFVFAWACKSAVELFSSAASRAPDLLILDEASVGSRLATILAELRGLAPLTVSLLVGAPGDIQSLGRSLSFGLRGVVPPARLESDLLNAARSVATGQIWFSRSLTAALLADRMQAPAVSASDTWRNLPALTARELAVLHEVLQGKTNKEIARALTISEQTVKIHLQNIFHKLRVHRRIDLMLLHGAAQA